MFKRFASMFLVAVLLVSAFSVCPVSAAGHDGVYGVYYAIDNVNLRTGPGTNYTSIAVIPSGRRVLVNDNSTSSSWYNVIYEGTGTDLNGYAYSSYIVYHTMIYKVTASALNLRSSASISGTRIATLNNNDRVHVRYTSGSWSCVDVISGVAQGLSGYVSSQYIALVNPQFDL